VRVAHDVVMVQGRPASRRNSLIVMLIRFSEVYHDYPGVRGLRDPATRRYISG
jgi:hypothetical protein